MGDIAIIVRGMQSLDEFTYYTIDVQKQMAKYLFYEEYGPNRTIFKQGNNSDFMYFIVMGALIYRGSDGTYLISKGEKIGETDIINNTRRIGTMQTQSEELQLVALHKEWYEMILIEHNEKGDGLPDIVRQSAVLQIWPTSLLPHNPSQWFIRNYKSDSWISDDLWSDEWVYIVKSGSCVVAKAIDELEMH